MLAHGFTINMLVKMVNAGLASVTIVVGKHRIEVARLRITEAGRRALGTNWDAQRN
jgi:hypothetical protein